MKEEEVFPMKMDKFELEDMRDIANYALQIVNVSNVDEKYHNSESP